MLRSQLESGRSEGGGANRRFMDVVGKDMKFVGVRVGRKKKTKGAEINGGRRLAVAASQGSSWEEKEPRFAVRLSSEYRTSAPTYTAP